jgi:hypothetical protein
MLYHLAFLAERGSRVVSNCNPGRSGLMQRNTKIAWLAVCVLTVAACSGSPETMTSPTGVAPAVTFANPDGSTVKVTEPRDLGPNGVTVTTLRPTLTWTNPIGVYTTVGYAYDVEVQNSDGAVIYSRVVGESPGSGSHTMESDLDFSTNYRFHVRARLGTQVGPWSGLAQFRTFDRPGAAPVPPGGGSAAGLPFPVPASCLAGNGAACSADVAAVSAEWARCRGGDGIGCHRFTRQVVHALSRTDPNWQMIQAAPGGHACNCNFCGPSDGTMFREDTTVYAGSQVYDMVIGAGGPSPSLTWSFVGAPRSVDAPGTAPVCP